MLTVGEIVAKFEHYLKKYSKRAGEKPLALKADIDDTFHTVSLKPISDEPFVTFVRTGFGEALSVSSVKAALEGLKNQAANVIVDYGATRYYVTDVAVEQKQTLILLTQKITQQP